MVCKIYSIFVIGLTTFAVITVLPGCAFGTREVKLKNSVPTNISHNNKKNHEVCFNGLADSRPDGNIGHVQNGYGMSTAQVIAVNKVPDWINTEIRTQLRMAGYTVNENCTPERTGKIELQGKIVKVYTTAYMTYLGEVTIDAAISLDSSIVVSKKYSGHTTGGANVAASSTAFGKTLEKSLKSVTTQLIADIDSIDRGDLIVDTRDNKTVIPVQSSVESYSDKKMYETFAYESKLETVECPKEKNGMVIVSGTRSRTSVKVVLDNIKADLRTLYNDRFELNPSLFGSICLQFSISSEGEVYDTRILQNNLNDKPIEDKLLQLLGKKKFYKLKEKKETIVSYNINFDSKSAKSSKGVLVGLTFVIAFIPLIFSIYNLQRF